MTDRVGTEFGVEMWEACQLKDHRIEILNCESRDKVNRLE